MKSNSMKSVYLEATHQMNGNHGIPLDFECLVTVNLVKTDVQ